MYAVSVDFSHEVVPSDTTNKIQEQSSTMLEQHPLMSISLQEKISQPEPMSPYSNETGSSTERGKKMNVLLSKLTLY